MSYPKTGEEVYVSLNLSNTMLTGLGKGTITREDVSVDYLKKLFMQHGVIVSAKPEYRNIMERVNSTYDLGLEIPAKLQLFQLSEQHRRLVVVNISGLQRKNGSLLPSHIPHSGRRPLVNPWVKEHAVALVKPFSRHIIVGAHDITVSFLYRFRLIVTL